MYGPATTSMPRASKPRGPVKRISIEKAQNGHSVSIHRDGGPKQPYQEPEQRVYGPGQHGKMISDVKQALNLAPKTSSAPPGGGKLPPDKQYQGAIRKGRKAMYQQISDQLAAGY